MRSWAILGSLVTILALAGCAIQRNPEGWSATMADGFCAELQVAGQRAAVGHCGPVED